MVGLGPAGPEWLTPEARAELAAADVLIGYESYLQRVPARLDDTRAGEEDRRLAIAGLEAGHDRDPPDGRQIVTPVRSRRTAGSPPPRAWRPGGREPLG